MARKRQGSRLARKESQRLMRQSVFFVALTIVALGALVVWGVPTLVKLATFLGEIQSADQPIEQGDTIPPYAPQLAISFEATKSAELNVRGYAEAGSEVFLYLDDEQVSESTVNDEGEFEFEYIELMRGENKLAVKAVDTAGNESDMSVERVVWFDDEPPTVSILSPDLESDNIVSDEKVFNVEGETEVDVKVYVNDKLARVDDEGGFRGQAVLNDGENDVTVRVIDRADNQTEVKFKVSYYE